MAKVGVCLSGCGVQDGSEIHESVIALLALDRANAEIICIAPAGEQRQVINHAAGEKMDEKRDILVEAARIARGDIKNVEKIKADDLDALIFPGGFGAALNLCDFGVAGEKCTVNPDVSRLINEMHQAKKPLGFICIAPAIAAKVLGSKNVQLTIGADSGTAEKLQAMGARHVDCRPGEIAVDQENKVVSTPAYMLAKRISEVAEGIEKLVAKIMEMA